jgi:hypothetical protein
MNLVDKINRNMDALRANPYPGRGIVLGQSPDGRHLVQIYWIMGRSENSRNRVFLQDDDVVRTAPHDESKVEDPSLIIYNCTRVLNAAHIVTNGDQTDTIYEAFELGDSFEQALASRTFEPDSPSYTPRISGVTNLDLSNSSYQLSILKTMENNPNHPVRAFFNYEAPSPGIGHFISTYQNNGNPLPSFEGEPQIVEVLNDIDDTLSLYWSALNEDNKVSLLVKFISPNTGGTDVRVVNKHDAG